MTTPAGQLPDDEGDFLDQRALMHDVDIIRRHRGITWNQVADETGVSSGKLSEMFSGKRRPGLLSFQRLTRWIDPAAREYLTAGAAPARVPAADKTPERFRQPAEAAA
jgi:transcriptional regulator with XRE-family HTH domain